MLSTSSIVGTDGDAPGREMLMPAALDAIRIVSAMGRPMASPARKKPVNTSPAAVVSTILAS